MRARLSIRPILQGGALTDSENGVDFRAREIDLIIKFTRGLIEFPDFPERALGHEHIPKKENGE